MQYPRKIKISGSTLLLSTKTPTKGSRDVARIEEYQRTFPLVLHPLRFHRHLPFQQLLRQQCPEQQPMDLSKGIQAIAAVAPHPTHQLSNFPTFHTVIRTPLTNNIQFELLSKDIITMKNRMATTTAFSRKGDTCKTYDPLHEMLL
jgi:hypothetical protein